MQVGKELIEADWSYSIWATETLRDVCTELAPAERSRKLGVSHSSVLLTLHHIFVSERFWAECLLRNEIPAFDLMKSEADPHEPSFGELKSMWPAVCESVRAWLANLPQDQLAAKLRCRFDADQILDLKRWEIVRHCVNHATLHRGQFVGRCACLGGARRMWT